MNLLKLSTLFLLVLSAFIATPIAAQQKRQTPAKPPVAPAPPPPTFDTLLAADSYKIYGEVRGVGQLIQSNTVGDLLDPVVKLSAPPDEFKAAVAWLKEHADGVMTSRMLVAVWPRNAEIPDALVAIEFASAEEAAKFKPQLDQFLHSALKPSVQEPPMSASADGTVSTPKVVEPPPPPRPTFYLQQTGSLLLLSPTPLEVKKLKPAGSKLLSQDANFRVARNRFNSESIFVFVNFKEIEREEEEQRKRYEEENKKAQEEQRKAAEDAAKAAAETGEGETPKSTDDQLTLTTMEVERPTPEPPTEVTPPDLMSLAFSVLGSWAPTDWPDAFGIALSLEGESFDLRALLVNAPGEKSDALPFLPFLIPAAAIAPESPNILPTSTELSVTMSLDLAQIHAGISRPLRQTLLTPSDGDAQDVKFSQPESPFAALEKQLKINVEDELLPLLGSEVVFSVPITGFEFLGLGKQPGSEPEKEGSTQPQRPGPFLALSLKDKDGMRQLLPKVIESIGFKGANSLAQTERREDTELVSFANVFSYAFVGNFVVLSTNPATTRHVVDSYLKHETLSGDINFRNYTRWQPRQLQAQVYISPALMQSHKAWMEDSKTLVTDSTRAFLTGLNLVAQPITYSLSNEGFGAMHELHVPKNLVLMVVAGISGEANPPPMVQNERRAMGTLRMLAYAQESYKTKTGGGFASLDQLIAEGNVVKEMLDSPGYKIELTVSGDGFQVTGVPVEYGKTGNMSFFLDQTHVLRGADLGGAPASASDQPIK